MCLRSHDRILAMELGPSAPIQRLGNWRSRASPTSKPQCGEAPSCWNKTADDTRAEETQRFLRSQEKCLLAQFTPQVYCTPKVTLHRFLVIYSQYGNIFIIFCGISSKFRVFPFDNWFHFFSVNN